MKHLQLVFVVGLIVAGIWGCGGSKDIIATVGSDKITVQDFEQYFAKSNGGPERAATLPMEDREKFLDLLVKFRLKVNEAKRRGLLSDPEIAQELRDYTASVATSYMLEKELIEPRLRDLYERYRYELRVSHILLRTPADKPEDTAGVYKQAEEIIALAKKGIPFDTLAVQFSQDPSAHTAKGDVGYFSVGRMVNEFEDAAYSLKVGEVYPVPVRTQFGYHVIKLTDKIPNNGSARISHIVRRFLADMSDTAAVRDTVWSVYRRIKSGELAFEQAVQEYSDDQASKTVGGNLGIYERDQVPYEYNIYIWNLPVDTVGEPLRVPYGYHIFKVTGRTGIKPFAEMEKELRNTYQALRYQKEYSALLAKLAKLYPVTRDSAFIEQISTAFDTLKNIFSDHWGDTLTAEQKAHKLFSVGPSSYTAADFARFADNNRSLGTSPLKPATVKAHIEKFIEQKLLEEHAKGVPQRHPEFAKLMLEYEDGILLYRIEQDEIWKKLTVNDSLLQAYYEQNKENYTWPDRVNFAEIYVQTLPEAQSIYAELTNGTMKIDTTVVKPARGRRGKPTLKIDTTYTPVTFSEAAEHHTIRSGYKEKKGEWGLIPVTQNALAERANTMEVGRISEPVQFQSGYSIITTLAKEPSRIKTFDEAGAELAGAFQDYQSKRREQQWIDELKREMPVTIFKERLAEVFKKHEGS